MRAIDWRTSWTRSEDASKATLRLIPVSPGSRSRRNTDDLMQALVIVQGYCWRSPAQCLARSVLSAAATASRSSTLW